MVYRIFYDYFRLKWYKNVTKLVENGMFLVKNILKLIKNSTFFIVIFIGFYWDFIGIVYIGGSDIIDLIIDIIIKHPSPFILLLVIGE